MSAIFECDNCKKQEPAVNNGNGIFKPDSWFQRSNERETQVVCSIECAQALNDKTNTQSMIIPGGL